MRRQSHYCSKRFVVLLATFTWLVSCGGCASHAGQGEQVASTLLDLSGLAWVGDQTFVAVHDAKKTRPNSTAQG